MKKLIAANWKMYKTRQESASTAQDLCKAFGSTVPAERDVVIFPSFLSIDSLLSIFSGFINIEVGAQNIYPAQEGAFTGEVSPAMLKDAGCKWVLTGHSERRSLFGETDETVAKKTSFSLEQGLNVIFCIGESLAQRENNELEKVLKQQITVGLKDVAKDISHARIAVAYEPVWAIGTGKVAGEKEILEAHTLVRKILQDVFGKLGNDIRILYGGSVKPDNAGTIMAIDNVDGVLVGGASLKAESFSQIIMA